MFQAVISNIAVTMVFSWALIWVFFLLGSFLSLGGLLQYYCVHYSPPGGPVLSQMNPVCALPSFSFEIYFSITVFTTAHQVDLS